MTTAGDVLMHLIDERCWNAAAAVARWQIERSRKASRLRVLKHCVEHGARAEVVLAFTLGVIQRAHLRPDGRVGADEGDYVCIHADATILNTRDPALCAALAIWLMGNPEATPVCTPAEAT